jgi:transposase-like protein
MSSKEVPSGRSRVRYMPEFKADAVAMVIDTGRTIVDVAQAPGLVE